MYELFRSVKGLTKLDRVTIDNFVFRLHYKATFLLLVISSMLVTARQFFGDPIACIVDGVDRKVMDTYCWIESTFTIPRLLDKAVGTEVAHPGVGGGGGNSAADDTKYHKYYQWVCFFLFAQAVCFYVPRYVWKMWERNRMRHLVADLCNPLIDAGTKRQQQRTLIEYLKENLNRQSVYAFRFFACEALNFANAIVQMLLVDRFLDREFSTYGLQVLAFVNGDQAARVDPMVRIFPKVTKCTFHKYGFSGSIEKFDGLCVLPLNIINEKIFVALWFWLIFVLVLSSLQLVYRTLTVVWPSLRLHMLRVISRTTDYRVLVDVHNRCDVGDWFVLMQLAKNIDTLCFKELLNELGEWLVLEEKDSIGKRCLRISELIVEEEEGQKKRKSSGNGSGGVDFTSSNA